MDLSSVWSPPPPGTVGLTAGVYVPFTLDVPLDACKEDGRTGHEMSLWVSSQTVPQLAKSVSVDCMDNSKVFLVQMNKPLYKPGDNSEYQYLSLFSRTQMQSAVEHRNYLNENGISKEYRVSFRIEDTTLLFACPTYVALVDPV